MAAKRQHIGLVALGGAGWLGGAAYIRNLARAIRIADPGARVTFLCAESRAKEWSDDGTVVTVAIDRRRGLQRLLPSGLTKLREIVADEQIEFLYPITFDNRSTLGLELPVRRQLGACQWAGWIPDFQHQHLPELFSQAELDFRRKNIGALVAEAPQLVFSSENARADFRTLYPGLAEKGTVLRFATAPDPKWFAPPAAPKDFEVPARFFLISNQFWTHKNHLLVFAALRLLAARGVQPIIVCTGNLNDPRDPNYAAKIRETLASSGLTERVKLLGIIPREAQIHLMRRALAVIQPSLFEGWSTVVEDARLVGRPCLLSDLAVHLEQNPPGARYFPRHSAEALAALIAEVWEKGTPGPDAAAEALARTAADTALADFGARFLEIARSTLSPS